MSLGQFTIRITGPTLIAAWASGGPPGYDPANHLLTSPLLYDPNTVIGLSTQYIDGSAPYPLLVGTTGTVNGTPVTQVTQTGPPVKTPVSFPANNNAISTAILNSQLMGGGVTVDIGAPYPSTGLAYGTPDLGEVESQSCNSPTNSCSNFPAQSFFDVYADVIIPGLGSFSNLPTDPLLVESTLPAPGALPPMVVYFHGQTGPVAIYSDADPSFELGTLVLAGHGISYGLGDEALFEQQYVVEYDKITPEPSTFVLLLSGAAGLLMQRRLRRSQ